ncbi:MAG: type I restriction-modification system subunit M [Clostridiaceae bacterium]|nr:type I restriction-modification system subunit M [Clostridiaceae bacterium]
MNKQQLASKIWESANKMRSKIEANEYKDYILGFIFYKFLSDKEVKYLKGNDWTEEDIKLYLNEEDTETVKTIQKNLGYFIAYENLFSTWLNMGNDFNVSNVRDALSAFNRLIDSNHKKVFDKIFDTLQTGLSKLGDTSGSQTKAIRDLIHLIKDIPMDGKQDYDVLGFIYEYLISNFAANAGKKAGEFYTPHEVSLLMSEIVAAHLKDRTEIKIYDPTSGSGSLLINIGKSVAKYMGDSDKIKYYAQELKENTYNLTRMNLIMRGINHYNIVTRNGDTLEEDWPYFEENDPIGTYNPLYVDAVVSNPPYSQHWNPTNKESDPRFKDYGLAPKSKADYAFLLHDLYHVKPDGIMTIVLPHGVLFRGGEEGVIRKNLIENNKIDAIIGLPANIFFGTGIPTIIMVLKQKRSNTDVLFIDASKGFEKVGKNNRLRASDIKRIVDVVTQRISVDKFSRVVSRDEIRQNDYNLNIPRYVDSSEKPESWDIYASMLGGIPADEVNELSEYWKAFPNLKKALFTEETAAYLHFSTEDIKKKVSEHDDIQSFEQKFKTAFEGFGEFLYKELIEGMFNLNVSMKESELSEKIFERLNGIPLVDKYQAYQILNDEWKRIAIDLEIIQTEGFESTRKVEPNMVVKKKDGRDIEVQDGWVGRVIPFELVQESMLHDALEELKVNECRLSEIASEYKSLIDELPEEEKDKDFINDDRTAFVPTAVKKAIKENEVEAETLGILKKYDALNTEEKAIKRKVKKQAMELQIITKKTIEELTDSQVKELLKHKWVNPVLNGLFELPKKAVNEFVVKLEALKKKYETTFFEVEEQIQETEESICAMLDELICDEFDMQGLAEFKKLLGGK